MYACVSEAVTAIKPEIYLIEFNFICKITAEVSISALHRNNQSFLTRFSQPDVLQY